MKVDLYTKTILTGIFACLCLIVLRDVPLENPAEAQNRPQAPTPVIIVGCTNGVGGPIGSVPVWIKGND